MHIRAPPMDRGSGNIIIGALMCNGNESTLSDCPASAWTSNTCGHNQDAGVNCGKLTRGVKIEH